MTTTRSKTSPQDHIAARPDGLTSKLAYLAEC